MNMYSITKGMVGLGRLYQIGRRLQEGRPHKRDQPFGGMSILLAGDLRQLQPVCDVPLYGELTDSNRTEGTSTGHQLYRMFDTETFKLEQQMRQGEQRMKSFEKSWIVWVIWESFHLREETEMLMYVGSPKWIITT